MVRRGPGRAWGPFGPEVLRAAGGAQCVVPAGAWGLCSSEEGRAAGTVSRACGPGLGLTSRRPSDARSRHALTAPARGWARAPGGFSGWGPHSVPPALGGRPRGVSAALGGRPARRPACTRLPEARGQAAGPSQPPGPTEGVPVWRAAASSDHGRALRATAVPTFVVTDATVLGGRGFRCQQGGLLLQALSLSELPALLPPPCPRLGDTPLSLCLCRGQRALCPRVPAPKLPLLRGQRSLGWGSPRPP